MFTLKTLFQGHGFLEMFRRPLEPRNTAGLEKASDEISGRRQEMDHTSAASPATKKISGTPALFPAIAFYRDATDSETSFSAIHRTRGNGDLDFLPDLSGMIKDISSTPLYEKQSASIFTGDYAGKMVALKVLKAHVSAAEVMEKLRRKTWKEMNIWFQLAHDNVIPLLGYDESFPSSVGAIVYPWCQNGHSRQYIKTQQLALHQRLALLYDVSKGLVYLHERNVVHGDLKPENILVNDQGIALLADFGMSHVINKSFESPTGSASFPHPTARYCAPELILSEGPIPPSTKESDIYSLGSVAVEFVFEIHPYERVQGFVQVIIAVSTGERPAQRPHTNALRWNEELTWNLIDSCWDSVPVKRPSAASFNEHIHYIRSLGDVEPPGGVVDAI